MSQHHHDRESTNEEKVLTADEIDHGIPPTRCNTVATEDVEKTFVPSALPTDGLSPLPQPLPTTLDYAETQAEKDPSDLAIHNDDNNNPTPTSTSPSQNSQPSTVALTPQTSVDGRGNTYPEGGLRAWLVVYGSFSGMTASFGLMNSVGTFQAYLGTHQLAHLDPSTTAWIFSLYTFMSFFCGVQIGPVFDARGPRVLMLAGTVCLVGGVLGIAESTGMFVGIVLCTPFAMTILPHVD